VWLASTWVLAVLRLRQISLRSPNSAERDVQQLMATLIRRGIQTLAGLQILSESWPARAADRLNQNNADEAVVLSEKR